jgi:pyridoxal phosphate enzyme (YggS family)
MTVILFKKKRLINTMDSNLNNIENRISEIIKSLPSGVMLVAAAKTRTVEEVQAAVRAGIEIIGYNYVQETERMQEVIGRVIQWHLIGHLQKNKIKKAVKLFDMIQTLDSIPLAQALDAECAAEKIKMPVLIEINSGREENKTGIYPEAADEFMEKLRNMQNLQVRGLMTMGPFLDDPAGLRPYFRETRTIYENLSKSNYSGVEMRFLSMGMSDSYKIALEEGANMIRLGTILFGPRR